MPKGRKLLIKNVRELGSHVPSFLHRWNLPIIGKRPFNLFELISHAKPRTKCDNFVPDTFYSYCVVNETKLKYIKESSYKIPVIMGIYFGGEIYITKPTWGKIEKILTKGLCCLVGSLVLHLRNIMLTEMLWTSSLHLLVHIIYSDFKR